MFLNSDNNPVLDKKIERAHDIMKSMVKNDTYSFKYKNSTWVFTVIGNMEEEPMFTLDVTENV